MDPALRVPIVPLEQLIQCYARLAPTALVSGQFKI